MSMWLVLLIDIAFFSTVLYVLIRLLKRNVIKLAFAARKLLKPEYPITPPELAQEFTRHGTGAVRNGLRHILQIAWKSYPKIQELTELAATVRLQFILTVGTIIASFVALLAIIVAAIVRAL